MGEIKQIGKFKVVAKLGQGSFGVVYKGYDPDIRRDVAIKVCTVDDVGLRKRFAREAQISGNLQHKNIVTVFAADTDENGIPYLVQEFLDGEDLRDLVRRREAIPSSQKIDYLVQVSRGLTHAHAHGVIHRDIKPANVRLLSDGKVKIMDFGIAKLASAETQLTQKGVTMGTASYLPPEQVRGGDLDHRADIFSFGVLAYELLTYERPFKGNTLSALVYQILYKVPTPMSAIWPECPDVLSDVVARCLEKKPEGRFPTMKELTPQLEHIADEIEAGKWPALRNVSTVQALLSDISDDTGVMSQSEIARTARVFEGSEAGEHVRPSAETTMPVAPAPPAASAEAASSAELTPAELTPAELTPAELTSTPEATSSVSIATALTQVIPTPAPPPQPAPELPAPPPEDAPAPATAVPESGPEAPTVMLSQEELTQHELAARAQQISSLIEKGELKAAKERLEQTMSEQLEATGQLKDRDRPASGSVALPLPDDSPLLTRPLPLSAPVPPAASTPAEMPLERARVPETGSWPQGPPASGALTQTLREPSAPQEPAGGATADGDSDSGSTSTYMTAIFSLPVWQRWAALVLAVVLAGVGWQLLGRGEKPGSVPAVETPTGMDTPSDPGVAAPEVVGLVTIEALPWAEVTEIRDADQFVKDLPETPFTPLRLELPPGRYFIQLEYHPDGGESTFWTCEVDIRAMEPASCRTEFPVPTVTDYFKESGWWR